MPDSFGGLETFRSEPHMDPRTSPDMANISLTPPGSISRRKGMRKASDDDPLIAFNVDGTLRTGAQKHPELIRSLYNYSGLGLVAPPWPGESPSPSPTPTATTSAATTSAATTSAATTSAATTSAATTSAATTSAATTSAATTSAVTTSAATTSASVSSVSPSAPACLTDFSDTFDRDEVKMNSDYTQQAMVGVLVDVWIEAIADWPDPGDPGAAVLTQTIQDQLVFPAAFKNAQACTNDHYSWLPQPTVENFVDEARYYVWARADAIPTTSDMPDNCYFAYIEPDGAGHRLFLWKVVGGAVPEFLNSAGGANPGVSGIRLTCEGANITVFSGAPPPNEAVIFTVVDNTVTGELGRFCGFGLYIAGNTAPGGNVGILQYDIKTV